MIEFLYSGSGRELKRIIVALLKKRIAVSIDRSNYRKRYTLSEEGVVEKKELKKVFVVPSEGKSDACVGLIQSIGKDYVIELTDRTEQST